MLHLNFFFKSVFISSTKFGYNNLVNNIYLANLMTSRLTWTKQEDDFLRKLVSTQEKTNWNEIMSTLNSIFPTKFRSAKQCRQRYVNYSSFNEGIEAISEWKSGDLQILYSQFDKYGARWTKIAQYLPEKSQNSIKNKFYGNLRKVIRKINMIGEASQKKIKKNIRYESIARIIEAAESFLTLSQEMRQESLELRQKILKLMRTQVLDQIQEEVYELINKINKFNLATRSYRPSKSKKFTQKHDTALMKHEQQDEKLQIKQEEIDENNGKITYSSTSASLAMTSLEQFNERRNNQKQIKKQNNQETTSKIKENSFSVFEFSPLIFSFQCSSKMQDQQQIDQYFLDLFPERESPLSGYDLM